MSGLPHCRRWRQRLLLSSPESIPKPNPKRRRPCWRAAQAKPADMMTKRSHSGKAHSNNDALRFFELAFAFAVRAALAFSAPNLRRVCFAILMISSFV